MGIDVGLVKKADVESQNLYNTHTCAHVEARGNWGQNCNELADKLSDLATRLWMGEIDDAQTQRDWECVLDVMWMDEPEVIKATMNRWTVTGIHHARKTRWHPTPRVW